MIVFVVFFMRSFTSGISSIAYLHEEYLSVTGTRFYS